MRAAAILLLVVAAAAAAGPGEQFEELFAKGKELEAPNVRRHDLAIPLFRDALRTAERSGDERLLARAFVALGRNLGGVHRYAEAEDALTRGFDHAVAAGDVLLQRDAIGWRAVFAQEQGRTDLAETLFGEVVSLGEKAADPGMRAQGLNGLAAVARRTGRPEIAIARAMEAMRAIDEAPPDKPVVARLHFQVPYNLGSALGETGDYASALVWLERALDAAERDENLAGIWHVMQDTAVWYQAMGDLPRAIRYYQRALEIAGRMASRDMTGITLRHYATAELEAGRVERAAARFEEALAVFEQHGIREGVPETKLGLARLSARMGNSGRALELVNGAIEEASRQEDEGLLILTRIARGGIRLDRGELDAAREDFDEAIASAVAAGLRPLVPAGVEGLARVARARGDLEAALRYFDESARLIESMREAIPSHEQRVAFASATHGTFAGMLDVLLDLDARAGVEKSDEALLAIERARTQSLRTTFVRAAAPVPVAQLAEQARVSAIQRRLATVTIPEEREMLGRALDDAERRLHAAESGGVGLEADASIDELRAALHPDEAFIAYAVANGEAVAFVVRRNETRIVRLGRLRDLGTRIGFFAALLGGETSSARTASGGRLASELLAPVLPAVGSGTKRLFFSASGAIAALPFAALPYPRTGEPLIARYEVAYVGSLRELAQIRGRAGPADAREVLAVGFGASGGVTPVAVTGAARRLAAIPYSEREVREVTERSLSGTLLAGGAATESALGQLPLERYGLIHFATHAVLDPVTPSRSGIVLARETRGDGVLRAREIAAWALDGPLVVLSACETAIGRESAAEGMQSLARAFQLAGARAVIGTMWPVEDRATARLVRKFYDELADGRPAGEAMRRAQLALAESDPWSTARTWAAFSVFGDPAVTIALPPRAPVIRRVVFGAVAVALLFFTALVVVSRRARHGIRS